MVAKYLFWLAGLWTNSGKWDQLKAVEYTETSSRAAGSWGTILGIWLLFCSILLCPEQPLWPTAPKWEPKSWPVSHRTGAFFFITIGKKKKRKDNPTSYFIKDLWIFTYTHLILCLSYLYQKLIIFFLVWWRSACRFWSLFIFARGCEYLELWNNFTFPCKGHIDCPSIKYLQLVYILQYSHTITSNNSFNLI